MPGVAQQSPAPTTSAPTVGPAAPSPEVTQPAGNAAAQQSTTAPPPPGGSAVVAGSAANSEFAFDNSYTPALIAAMQANPNLSLAEVLDLMGQQPLAVAGSQPLHHPVVAEYGDRTASVNPESKKMAVFVANQNYNFIGGLSTPIAEANAMQGALTGRGYETKGVQQDQNANGMVTHFAGLVGEANAGDEVVCYYGGHGAEEGLVGVDYSSTNNDIFFNSTVSTVVNIATTKGAHIRFIMDSCHSGSAAQLVRDEQINELTANADTFDRTIYGICAESARDSKNKLMDHVHRREAALNGILTAYNDYLQTVTTADPAVTSAFRSILVSVRAAFDAAATALWASMTPTLESIRGIVGTSTAPIGAPPAIDDFRTLGTQCDYVDELANAALARAAEEPAQAATAP